MGCILPILNLSEPPYIATLFTRPGVMQKSSSSASVSGMTSLKDPDQHQDRIQQAHEQLPYSRPATPGAGSSYQIGFIGLGNMGYFMARNLANHLSYVDGPPLLVWNRSTGKSDELVKEVGQEKAKIAHSVEEIAKKSDILITSLGSDAAVSQVYAQITKALKVRLSYQGHHCLLSNTLPGTRAGACSKAKANNCRRNQHCTLPSTSH